MKAQNDLKTAEILDRENGPTDSLCFHCQQAIEKYLMAFLCHRQVYFPKIHLLWKLAELSAQADQNFLTKMKEFRALDAYYIESRYPPDIQTYSKKEAQDALKIAEQLGQFIIKKII